MRESERRRSALLAIIAHNEIRTQDELVDALEKRGFRASQASVSRDISALRLVKAEGRYVRSEALEGLSFDPLRDRVRGHVLGMRGAGEHMVVLETPPGEASAVALALDQIGVAGVAGTIAGDDTIFVAVESSTKSAKVMRDLRSLVG
jgi:transcriptional regulator of arginine metabolism